MPLTLPLFGLTLLLYHEHLLLELPHLISVMLLDGLLMSLLFSQIGVSGQLMLD